MTNEQELLENVKIDLLQLGCNQPFVCPYSERTISYAIGIATPEPITPPEIVFKECCYVHIVLADLSSSDSLKNDYSSFYHQRQISSESIEFLLYDFKADAELPLDDTTFGQFFDFGNFETNENLTGYLVEWRKVLAERGEGSYKIIKRQTLAGADFETESFVFTLKNYSEFYSDKTVRVDVLMNGLLRKSGVDFTGTNWKHSIRVGGFFGNREPQFEEDVLVDRFFKKEQISMAQTNEFKFQTNLVPSCVTDEIFDFMLFANTIEITDYNLNNHSYNYKKYAVRYSGNDNTDYNSRRRKARLNLIFNDAVVNNRKNNFY